MAWAIAALLKPKALLVAENTCLRQQLVVLRRRQPRPRLRHADRRFWILASQGYSGWRDVLLIVQPETVLRWQCAPKARITSGGGFHPESCRLVW
jgi:hypothetical protein